MYQFWKPCNASPAEESARTSGRPPWRSPQSAAQILDQIFELFKVLFLYTLQRLLVAANMVSWGNRSLICALPHSPTGYLGLQFSKLCNAYGVGASMSSGRTHSSNCASVTMPSVMADSLSVVPSLCAFLAAAAALS